MSELLDQRIVLGVSGGIAAYKAVMIASMLVQRGARVDVVMTEGARHFVQPLTFSAITQAPVHTDLFAPWREEFAGHITLAERADLVLVAPATASAIARLALGLSDDLLGLVSISTRAPILLAPAMEERMFRHPATQDHLRTLVERGVAVVGPEPGRLASGASGFGRMSEPAVIVQHVVQLLQGSRELSGFQIVVTAGGTREALDPVRYFGNRSSGRMGYAIAKAAVAHGADVTLITGPTAVAPPAGATVVRVESAMEMLTAVQSAIPGADVLIMAAAVADFRPETIQASKIKKERGQEHIDVRLVRNPDILESVNEPGLVKIGFAAETDNLLEHASSKLQAKNLDMIVANDAEATIGAENSTATFLMADGAVKALPRLPKEELAVEIVRAAAELLAASHRPKQ